MRSRSCRRIGIENVFALTGDFPKGSKEPAERTVRSRFRPVGGIHQRSARAEGYPFYISAAVSPFKYTEPDCAYQYLKLEKKIAAGADYAITQLGYDSRKMRELRRYMDERGLRTPVFGNVYVLPLGAAKRFHKGDPPGCFASKELVEQVQAEVDASTDKGMAARLERAAKMVAIQRGLGFAGSYIGGDHHADRIRWIIERSEVLAPKWEELGRGAGIRSQRRILFLRISQTRTAEADLLEPCRRYYRASQYAACAQRSVITGTLRLIDKSPTAAAALESVELAFKKPVFGCQACGNCVLGLMEYVCPMTCPKNLRNGPCGGTHNGQCEVIPEQKCIWVEVYNRAKAADRVDELKTYIPQRDRSLKGTSSYINYFLDRDSRPEHPQPLIQISGVTPAPAARAEESARQEVAPGGFIFPGLHQSRREEAGFWPLGSSPRAPSGALCPV